MSFSNFSKTIMLSALLEKTVRIDGKHKVALAHNGVLLDPNTYLGADPLYVTLHIYGHNPPVVTHEEPMQWIATSTSWPSITEVYILADRGSNDVMLTGRLTTPYLMPLGKNFTVPALSWEASLV